MKEANWEDIMRAAQSHGSDDIWYGPDGKIIVGAVAPKGWVNVSEGMRKLSAAGDSYDDNSAMAIEEYLDRYVYEAARKRKRH